MSQPWLLPPPVTPSPALIDLVGHPVAASILARRGFDKIERALPFVDPAHYTPAPPTNLIGVDKGARLLLDAVEGSQNMLVWGDFDVDGQTSTALLVAALQELAGRERVRFHIPNRFSEGHGIGLEKLRSILDALAADDFSVDLLLTCDTGIAEAESVAYAKERGLTVVITDHHDLTPEFDDWDSTSSAAPPASSSTSSGNAGGERAVGVRRADAIINPKLQPPDDALRTLPGVGVAYKLIQHLFTLAGCPDKASDFLDLVALGIVADVAEQVHDARFLLQRGLEQLRQTRRTGLLALMEVARLVPQSVDAEAIGFQLGPRMNALGRLDDATVSVELLTTRDPVRAGQLAAAMERLNNERRLLTSQITASALETVERTPSLLDFNGLVLAHSAWHAGIVGIVASRLAEEFGKPTVLLLKPPGDLARGSARSTPGIDIGASIAACSHLLIAHGGHPGAAGVTLLPEQIDAFRRELDRQIAQHTIDDAPVGVQVDAEVELEALSMDLVAALSRVGPFGNGNPTPRFLSRAVTVTSDRRIGKEGTHRRLQVRQTGANGDESGASLPVIWFGGGDVELPVGPLDLLYELSINEYRGERSLQLRYVASRRAQVDAPAVSVAAAAVAATPPAERAIHDLRGAFVDPSTLPAPGEAVWYVEGTALGAVDYAPRTSLLDLASPLLNGAANTLVVWSVPPPHLLAALLDRLEPSAIYLCGQPTADDTLPNVLRGVASMAKYALTRAKAEHGSEHRGEHRGEHGRLPLDRLAARLGTSESVVRHALLWLDARGRLRIVDWAEGDTALIATGDGVDRTAKADLLRARLDEELAEVAAYRRFFLRAPLRSLVR